MSGLRDQRERVGAQAEVERRHDVTEGRGERHNQHALHPARRCGHHVHALSLVPTLGALHLDSAMWVYGQRTSPESAIYWRLTMNSTFSPQSSIALRKKRLTPAAHPLDLGDGRRVRSTTVLCVRRGDSV